jgi:sodium-dependent phosphate cotransporter
VHGDSQQGDVPRRSPSERTKEVSSEHEAQNVWIQRARKALNVARFLGALYIFLLSIALMSTAFKGFGEGFARVLIQSTTNPIVGLFIGILTTSLVQSSSCTTSMVVSLVAAGTLSVRNAVPIVMGANIGTTVTAFVVSLGHITRKEEFRRAMAGSTVHDFFNILSVLILMPIELMTRYLERTATFLSAHLMGTSDGLKYTSPIKAIVSPSSKYIYSLLGGGGASPVFASIMTLVVALAILFFALWVMVRVMKGIMATRAEAVLDKTIGRAPILGLVVGLVLTAVIQSSSVVTSMLVPLAGAGVLTPAQIFPITMGANMGTTVTAFLAALAAGPAGLTIALTHMLFNATGVIIFFPIERIRMIPVRLAGGFANIAAESKRYALLFVFGLFFAVPGTIIFISEVLL